MKSTADAIVQAVLQRNAAERQRRYTQTPTFFDPVLANLALVLALPGGCSLPAGGKRTGLLRRPDLRRATELANNEEAYLDKVHGAWSGKLIGLILGQPTEGWGKEQIERKTREAGC